MNMRHASALLLLLAASAPAAHAQQAAPLNETQVMGRQLL